MLGGGIVTGPQEPSTVQEDLAGPDAERPKVAMEEEIQQKDNEPQTREAGEPPGPRVPMAAPVTHATPSADERSEGPKTDELRTRKEQQIGPEDRTSSGGDECARGGVIEPPMDDNG